VAARERAQPGRPAPTSETLGARVGRASLEPGYRALDLLIASVTLLVCAPLLLAACVLIRLESPGPAIFRQRRLGRNKRPFTVHKLRTMRLGASPQAHREYVGELISGVETARSDGHRSLYKLIADDRVTRVGRVLRRTSLDELPQLFDVLRGEMSLVGPRPVTPYEAEMYPPAYERRFAVKPGLTGLWQISGRNACTYREMVTLDIAWAEQRSLARYVSILARTPWVLLRASGAG
jgi:lipopolysaccharide/colanic/teichoic acid biosynthesis glycosyltransferase